MRQILISMLLLGFVSCDSNVKETKTLKDKSSSIVKVENHEIKTRSELDQVFKELPIVAYKDLDKEYKKYSDPDKKFESKLRNSFYYVIEPNDLYRRVVGVFTVGDFVATDKYYHDLLLEKGKIYWLADKKMLYMFLELIQQLRRKGYNEYAYTIRNSHRHPFWNSNKWKGAKNSQHIYGKAVDLRIGDINRDGKANQTDKKIVLKLLEKIVGNKGGIGKYPGTMCLHFDSRGYRARWDKQ